MSDKNTTGNEFLSDPHHHLVVTDVRQQLNEASFPKIILDIAVTEENKLHNRNC
jgi:hypothetical protein